MIYRNDPEAVAWSLANPQARDSSYREGFFSLKRDNERGEDDECWCAICSLRDWEDARLSGWDWAKYRLRFYYIAADRPMNAWEEEQWLLSGRLNRKSGIDTEAPWPKPKEETA